MWIAVPVYHCFLKNVIFFIICVSSNGFNFLTLIQHSFSIISYDPFCDSLLELINSTVSLSILMLLILLMDFHYSKFFRVIFVAPNPFDAFSWCKLFRLILLIFNTLDPFSPLSSHCFKFLSCIFMTMNPFHAF